jgi:hypothetical protein
MIDKILRDRVTGSYGLSVGTAHVLETLFGPDESVYKETREVPNLNYKKYKYFYFNLYTILRNLLSASDKSIIDLINKSSYDKVLELVYTEIETIESLFNGTKTSPVWYLFDYSKSHIEIKNADTKAHNIYRLSKDILSNGTKEFENICSNTILEGFKLDDVKSKKVLINTHIAQDLLNVNYVDELVLIESVTGTVVKSNKFNKKYPSSKAYQKDRLPFNEVILRLLGDGFLIRQAFKQKDFDSRKLIGELSVKYSWNPSTTIDRVILNLKSTPDGRDMYNAIKNKLIYK